MVPRMASRTYRPVYGSLPAAQNATISTALTTVWTRPAMCGEPCWAWVRPMVFFRDGRTPSRPSAYM